MQKINTKLLSLVLGEEILEVKDIQKHDTFLEFYCKTKVDICTIGRTFNSVHGCYIQYLNLDTLNRKCKEFCWKQGHSLCTTPLMANPSIYYCWDELESSRDETISIKGNSELEAILIATEYIAEQKGLL